MVENIREREANAACQHEWEQQGQRDAARGQGTTFSASAASLAPQTTKSTGAVKKPAKKKPGEKDKVHVPYNVNNPSYPDDMDNLVSMTLH